MDSLVLGVLPRTEPLDHESEAESGQRLINHDFGSNGPLQLCCSAATRGESLSRESRKSQNETVKKNLVIESCESIRESFGNVTARLLRVLSWSLGKRGYDQPHA